MEIDIASIGICTKTCAEISTNTFRTVGTAYLADISFQDEMCINESKMNTFKPITSSCYFDILSL